MVIRGGIESGSALQFTGIRLNQRSAFFNRRSEGFLNARWALMLKRRSGQAKICDWNRQYLRTATLADQKFLS